MSSTYDDRTRHGLQKFPGSRMPSAFPYRHRTCEVRSTASRPIAPHEREPGSRCHRINAQPGTTPGRLTAMGRPPTTSITMVSHDPPCIRPTLRRVHVTSGPQRRLWTRRHSGERSLAQRTFLGAAVSWVPDLDTIDGIGSFCGERAPGCSRLFPACRGDSSVSVRWIHAVEPVDRFAFARAPREAGTK